MTHDYDAEIAETLTRCAAQIGTDVPTLRRRILLAGWSIGHMPSKAERSDWPAQLDADLAARETEYQERDESTIHNILRSGPSALASVPSADLRRRIDRRLRDLIETYHPMQDGSAVILGPTRVGKSTLCVELLRQYVPELSAGLRQWMLDHGHCVQYQAPSVVWARELDLCNAVTQHPLGKGWPEAVTRALDAQLLILDDLGWGSRTDVTATLAAHRYDSGKCTITTSGYTYEELSQKYSSAIIRTQCTDGPATGRAG